LARVRCARQSDGRSKQRSALIAGGPFDHKGSANQHGRKLDAGCFIGAKRNVERDPAFRKRGCGLDGGFDYGASDKPHDAPAVFGEFDCAL
jgi:hypothetical protein